MIDIKKKIARRTTGAYIKQKRKKKNISHIPLTHSGSDKPKVETKKSHHMYLKLTLAVIRGLGRTLTGLNLFLTERS